MDYIESANSFLPCPTKSGYEITNSYKLPKNNFEGRIVSGISSMGYDKATDTLWLLSDDRKNTYLAPISNFSNTFTLGNKIQKKLSYGNLLYLKNKYNKRKIIDGEALYIFNSKGYIVTEGEKWNWKRPFDRKYIVPSLLEVDLSTGELIRLVNLPRSIYSKTNGIESLTHIKGIGFLVANEGRIKGNKILRKLKLYKPDSFRNANYALFDYDFNLIKKGTIYNLIGALREFVAINKSNTLITISTEKSFSFIQAYIFKPGKDFKLSNLSRQWQIKSSEKWEGIIPFKINDINKFIIVNDDDDSPNTSSYLSILSPIREKHCF